MIYLRSMINLQLPHNDWLVSKSEDVNKREAGSLFVCSFYLLVEFYTLATKSVKNSCMCCYHWNSTQEYSLGAQFIPNNSYVLSLNATIKCYMCHVTIPTIFNLKAVKVRLRILALNLISYPTLDSLIILLVTTSVFIYIDHKMHEEIR